jgi:hypothetical protein
MAVFAFGVTLMSWPRSANADLGTLTASVSSAAIGQTVTVTASMSNLSGASVTLIASSGTWATGTVSTGEAVTGAGTSVLAFTSNGSTVASSLVGTYTCAASGTVTFTLSQNPAPATGSSVLTTTLTCAAQQTTITVTPPAAAVNTAATVSATCSAAGDLLNSVGPGQFVAFPPPANTTVVAGTSVSCLAAGSLTVTFICTGDGIVTFSMTNASGTLYCGNTSSILQPFCPAAGYPYGTAYPYGTTNSLYPFGNTSLFPYNNGYNNGAYPYNLASYCNLIATPVVAAASLTLTASAAHIACGSSAFVTVRVNGSYANQYMPDGTQVSLSTSGGTVNPTSGTTQGGNVLATFQAPTTPGTVTVSAASGNATGSVTINVDCPVQVVPVAPAAPVVPVQSIVPPNTGDAGLSH